MKEYMPNRNRLADSANWLTDQDLSNDTTFSQIKSRVPVPLMGQWQFFKIK